VILNVFASLDTPICAMSGRKFNGEAGKLDNTVVLCISMGLPFAHQRFCSTEGIKNITPLSELRMRSFGETYGVRIIDGPLSGLLSRCVIVLDSHHKVTYSEQVPEIKREPDYHKAIEAIKKEGSCSCPY